MEYPLLSARVTTLEIDQYLVRSDDLYICRQKVICNNNILPAIAIYSPIGRSLARVREESGECGSRVTEHFVVAHLSVAGSPNFLKCALEEGVTRVAGWEVSRVLAYPQGGGDTRE